jgi:hypothetical protein
MCLALNALPAASQESGPHLSGEVEKILASQLLNLPKPAAMRIAHVAVSVPFPAISSGGSYVHLSWA